MVTPQPEPMLRARSETLPDNWFKDDPDQLAQRKNTAPHTSWLRRRRAQSDGDESAVALLALTEALRR